MLQKFNSLSPAEAAVILNKQTEAPFSGRYNNFNKAGVYVCRRCGTELYRSDNKFEANCGWPSFDAEIKDAVEAVPDIDGVRTEIMCRNCGAHLGHIFLGEQLTARNTRHCVNSLSLTFKPYE